MKNKEYKDTRLLARCGYMLPVFLVALSLFLTPFALSSSDTGVKNPFSSSLTLGHPKPVKLPLHTVTEETLTALIKEVYFIADLDSFLPAPAYYFSSQESSLFLDEVFTHDFLNLEILSSKNHPPTHLA